MRINIFSLMQLWYHRGVESSGRKHEYEEEKKHPATSSMLVPTPQFELIEFGNVSQPPSTTPLLVSWYPLLPFLLLPLHLFPYPHRFLADALDALDALALLVHGPAFQNAVDDFGSVDVREGMGGNLAQKSHLAGISVRVVGSWQERDGGAVVNRREGVGKVVEKVFAGCEGGGEDEGRDVLLSVISIRDQREGPYAAALTLHCSTQRPRSKMFMIG